ncbi:hypothetical protein [Fodinicola feengrottensis]|uniref:Uncharacterized protein n=1 Tax=Fodinicola feengrottensis TaxID=435914 RepID=A0ABN2IAS0_9ACTN|nr:hypothetical protein [Fodinicola feengrottensis]
MAKVRTRTDEVTQIVVTLTPNEAQAVQAALEGFREDAGEEIKLGRKVSRIAEKLEELLADAGLPVRSYKIKLSDLGYWVR